VELMLRLCTIVVVSIIAIDQATKFILVGILWNPPKVIEVFGFLSLVPVENRGISFGLFQELGGFGRWIISVFSIIVTIGLLIWVFRQKLRFKVLSISLIIGGAIGNIIDRLRQGWVIDFIDVYIDTWHWPAFNFADASISIGIVFLLFDSLLRPQKRPK